jgi:hypothetical protein
MIKLFEGLLGCQHKWDVIAIVPVFDTDTSSKYPIYKKAILRCKHCGDVKSNKL